MKHLDIRTRSLSSLIRDVEKGKFDFDHPFQRQSGQWNRLMMSKLIDSALRYYPIFPILVEEYENGIFGVIDGKQRLTIFADYFKNGFALHPTIQPIVIDDNTYELAGRKFEDKESKNKDAEKKRGKKSKYLDEDVRDRLKNIEIQLYIMRNPTADDIREIFARINSSKGLTNTQRRTVYESSELSEIINELKSYPVLRKLTTQKQRLKDEDKDIIRQTLMLSEKSNEYDFGSFRDGDINKFITRYNDMINHDKINSIKVALETLDTVLDEEFEKSPIKKTTAPILIYSYYRVIKDKKSISKWNEWIKNFLSTYETNEEYKQYCNGSGTASAEMVNGRLEYFRKAIRNL